MPKRRHDYFDFTNQIKTLICQEYERIQNRVREDPGTAGDQAEENWATILREWLPSNYPVVTKGQIIDDEGNASPKVDVLILKPFYPTKLREKKLYFAGGVVAAFECKLTLRNRHLLKSFQTAATIKSMLVPRSGTPYEELHQPIIYGILAHAHEIGKADMKSLFSIQEQIHKYHQKWMEQVSASSPALCHPRYHLDLISVASIATIHLTQSICMGPIIDDERRDCFGDDSRGGLVTSYMTEWETADDPFDKRGYVLGWLIAYLTNRLAFEDSALRPFAEYLTQLGVWGGTGPVVTWSSGVFSDEVASKLSDCGCDDEYWSMWKSHY